MSFFLLFMLLWLSGAACLTAQGEENLLQNGGFETVSGEMPAGWTRGMWVTAAGASYLELSDDAHSGQRSVLVENTQDNDARFEQVVSVRPNSYYRLSAYIKAEGIDESSVRGANISFADVYETSESVYDTQGEWVYVELYVRTGKTQREATVMARVGGYSATTSGRAWFDDIVLEKVKAVPEGKTYVSLATPTPVREDDKAQGTPGLAQILLLVAAGTVFALLLPRRRDIREDGRAYARPFAAVLAGAFLLRAVLAVLVPGYEVDINCFAAWSNTMFAAGPAEFYQTTSFCDYPPAYLYVLYINGALMKLLGTGYSGAAFYLILKLAPILLDIACAAMIFGVARRAAGEKKAFILASLYAFCPATLIVSACWGQIDAVLIALLLVVLLSASRARFDIALPVYILAALTKPQAFLLAPLGICALFFALAPKEGRSAMLRNIGVGVLYALAVAAAVVIPFSLRQEDPLWLVHKYVQTLSSYDYATLSTGNLMFLLGGNWKEASAASPLGLSYTALGWTLMIALIAYVAFLSLKGKRLSLLCEHAAILMLLLCTLGVKMHERYMLPALAFLLTAYAFMPDRRTLWAFALASFTLTVNCGVVLLFEHLIYPNEWVGYLCGAVNLCACGVMAWTGWDHAVRGKAWPLAEPEARPYENREEKAGRELLEGEDARLHMQAWDWALVAAVTLAYAAVAFVHLGDTKAPQNGYVSTAVDETVVFDLGHVQEEFNIYYYGGISDVSFQVSVSNDGTNWVDEEPAQFDVGTCFRWMAHQDPVRNEDGTLARDAGGKPRWTGGMTAWTGRYVRIRFDGAGAQLWEVAFVRDGEALPIAAARAEGAREGRAADPAALWDEQDSVPDAPGYLSGTYFDEIYHARTAYEYLHGLNPYETTHPPLGKLIIALGVAVFGMTPFGWRVMGTLFGVAMLPLMYLMGKQLFKGKRAPSFLCMALMALDMMHFTQTRIATIDTYVVFFIMAMFLCMLRWTRMNFLRDSLWRTLAPLFLSGLFMAFAIASKWTGIYAAAGLAVLFFIRLYGLWRQSVWARAHAQEDSRLDAAAKRFHRACLITLGCCCIFFIVIPVAVYCLSYIPHLAPGGPVTLTRIWRAQLTMFRYHSQLQDNHFFKSPWWQWPLIMKPMWYYDAPFKTEGMISTILCFGNPAVWWTGMVAMAYVLARCVRRQTLPALRAGLEETREADGCLVFLSVGFLAQYLPWVLVPRSTFIYHYFTSVPFIILAIGLCYVYIERLNRTAARRAMGVLLAVALLLFVGFYPLGSGAVVPRAWGDAMNWFKAWMYY